VVVWFFLGGGLYVVGFFLEWNKVQLAFRLAQAVIMLSKMTAEHYDLKENAFLLLSVVKISGFDGNKF